MLMISQSLRIRNLGPESWVPWVCVSGSLRGLLVTAEAAGISRVNGEGSASQLTHVAVVAAGTIQFLMDWCTRPPSSSLAVNHTLPPVPCHVVLSFAHNLQGCLSK